MKFPFHTSCLLRLFCSGVLCPAVLLGEALLTSFEDEPGEDADSEAVAAIWHYDDLVFSVFLFILQLSHVSRKIKIILEALINLLSGVAPTGFSC